jgi:hypothetical protein
MMSDIKAVFQAIAQAVQEQLAEQYPSDKGPTIFVSEQEMAEKLEKESQSAVQESVESVASD